MTDLLLQIGVSTSDFCANGLIYALCRIGTGRNELDVRLAGHQFPA